MCRLTVLLVLSLLMASSSPVALMAESATPTTKLVNGVTYFSVDHDGRTLEVACYGSGSPTFLQEIGGPDPEGGVISIEQAGEVVSGWIGTRFCGYDRAGTGKSPADPRGVRSFFDAGTDLLAVLADPETACPCVVMGESLGGGIVLAAMARDLTNFAGFVSLDSLTPGFAEEVLRQAPAGSPEADLGPFFAGENEEQINYYMSPEMVPSETGDIPIRILTHGAGDPPPCPCSAGYPVDLLETAWQSNQQALADALGVELIVAQETGHVIAGENPELVVDIVLEVISEVDETGIPATPTN